MDIGTPRRRDAAGAALGVALAVTNLLETALDTAPGGAGGLDARGVAISAWIGASAALAGRRPLAGVVALQAAVAVPVLGWDYRGPGGAFLIADLLLVGLLAYRSSRWPTVAGWVLGSVVPSIALVLAGESAWELPFFALILGAGAAVGVLLRRERSRSAQLAALTRELAVEREHRARTAVEEERARISRELHDAVAHTVSVMTLQVGVVRRRLGAVLPADAPEIATLAAAEELGRGSVDELRRVVGALRPDEAAGGLEPRAGLARVDDLVESVRRAGLAVEVEQVGDAVALPAGVDLAAYRVLQEGLTNALRHGGPVVRVAVRLVWQHAALHVTVTDDGGRGRRDGHADGHVDGHADGRRTSPDGQLPPGAATPAAAGVDGAERIGGLGLVGLRERVELFGGHLSAGPQPGGGFRLEASLPVHRTTAAAPRPTAPVPAEEVAR